MSHPSRLHVTPRSHLLLIFGLGLLEQHRMQILGRDLQDVAAAEHVRLVHQLGELLHVLIASLEVNLREGYIEEHLHHQDFALLHTILRNIFQGALQPLHGRRNGWHVRMVEVLNELLRILRDLNSRLSAETNTVVLDRGLARCPGFWVQSTQIGIWRLPQTRAD